VILDRQNKLELSNQAQSAQSGTVGSKDKNVAAVAVAEAQLCWLRFNHV